MIRRGLIYLASGCLAELERDLRQADDGMAPTATFWFKQKAPARILIALQSQRLEVRVGKDFFFGKRQLQPLASRIQFRLVRVVR